MEKLTFTGDFPKINIKVYEAEFIYEINGKHCYKKAYRDYIIPELQRRFEPAFPKTEGWMHLYRNVDHVPKFEYSYLVVRGDEVVHFQRSLKDWKKRELYVQLYDENLPKLDAALAQPLQFTKVGALQMEKRLNVVPLKVAKRQCLLKRNKEVIKKVLLERIADPEIKRKRMEDLCEEVAWGVVCVMPEIYCPTPSKSFERSYDISFELIERLYYVAERCLREMQEDGQIRLVRKSFRLPKGT